ncbi:MAG: DUF1415 domain-containing protein [Halomonadaceae bacterium]|nr:MAG: DUF1415 domain-containing protein [Halomonadaceae bacterium]
MTESNQNDHGLIETQTRQWVERVVVGLNLCPFARKPLAAGQVRIAVSDARTEEALLETLNEELLWLEAQPVSEAETTLLVVPHILADFLDYNDFLHLANGLLQRFGWEGEFQIASFHPQYQFAGTEPEDAENYSNRSPMPMLHLLREASLDQAVASHPAPEQIPERNIAALNQLGQPALAALLEACRQVKNN